MRNYADFNSRKIPPTRAEREAEMTATCGVCGRPAYPIDHLPGNGTYCENCGIDFPAVDASDPRSEEERNLDKLAADEAATIRSIRPGG